MTTATDAQTAATLSAQAVDQAFENVRRTVDLATLNADLINFQVERLVWLRSKEVQQDTAMPTIDSALRALEPLLKRRERIEAKQPQSNDQDDAQPNGMDVTEYEFRALVRYYARRAMQLPEDAQDERDLARLESVQRVLGQPLVEEIRDMERDRRARLRAAGQPAGPQPAPAGIFHDDPAAGPARSTDVAAAGVATANVAASDAEAPYAPDLAPSNPLPAVELPNAGPTLAAAQSTPVTVPPERSRSGDGGPSVNAMPARPERLPSANDAARAEFAIATAVAIAPKIETGVEDESDLAQDELPLDPRDLEAMVEATALRTELRRAWVPLEYFDDLPAWFFNPAIEPKVKRRWLKLRRPRAFANVTYRHWQKHPSWMRRGPPLLP